MNIAEYLNAGILAVNAFVLILGFTSFVYQTRQNRKVQKDQVENQKIEIYQRLELQSGSVFAFEADNKDVVALFKTHLAPVLPQQFGKPEDDTDLDEAKLIVRKYYEISCNLFEVAARLRRRDIVDHEVFASWVAWFFDTAGEWGFRALWHDMRDNYTPDLRDVFDRTVDELIAEWDIPYAKGEFDAFAEAAPAGHKRTSAADLTVSDEIIDAKRKQFYKRLAKVFDCPAIENWIESSANEPERPAHPLAFR